MQRADIIQAAAQIFREKGYHAASMQDIANAVNVQKASLYHHIESKQDLLLAILDMALGLLIEDITEVVQSDLTTEEKFRKAMHAYIDRLTQDADLSAVLLLEYRSLEPDVRAQHITRRDHYEKIWRRIIREGMDEGIFRDMDETLVAFAVLGIQNWMITWYREEGRLQPYELADRFCNLFLTGLKIS